MSGDSNTLLGSSNTLVASLIWGSVGLGFAIYGKKQREWVPWIGGVALMTISYFITSALYMSLAGAVLVTAMILLRGRF